MSTTTVRTPSSGPSALSMAVLQAAQEISGTDMTSLLTTINFPILAASLRSAADTTQCYPSSALEGQGGSRADRPACETHQHQHQDHPLLRGLGAAAVACAQCVRISRLCARDRGSAPVYPPGPSGWADPREGAPNPGDPRPRRGAMRARPRGPEHPSRPSPRANR